MILISLEPWDLVNEVWMWFRTKWVHKSNDLLHGICLYLKNIINLCTDNTAKAHRDRGWCVARQIPGAKAQKWGCCKGSRESLERSMRAHIALQMPQSCWQHSCELMCTGSTSGSLQAGQSNTYLSLQSGLICWYFKKKIQEWQDIRYSPGQRKETQTWKSGSKGKLLVWDYLCAPPGFLTAAERPKVYFCGKYWCLSWELPIHSGCLGSSKNLGSSVPRESTLRFTGGGFSDLGLKWPKATKNREHMTLNLKLLWFCGINIIFNVEGIFSWAVHIRRSCHMSSFTTSHYFVLMKTYSTNTAYIKCIVREGNPVTGFTMKERSNRNTKTTL